MKETLIKVYFYVTSGQSVIDKFRYLIMGIFALYVMLKLDSFIYLGLMLLASVPILYILGYVNVHYISKVQDKLNTEHGTHYVMKQFELVQEQTELLKEVLIILKR